LDSACKTKIGFREVRRVLSITLLVLFLWPYLAASFLQTTEASLPMCCRAKGKHHCMMAAMTRSRQGVAVGIVREKCPAFPKATAWSRSQPGTAQQEQSDCVKIVADPNVIRQIEAEYRIAWSRSRQKRGPSSLLG